jgi:hypothetical protein
LVFTTGVLFQSDDYIDHLLSYGFIDLLSYISISIVKTVLVIIDETNSHSIDMFENKKVIVYYLDNYMN